MILPKTYPEYILLASVLGIDVAKVITNQYTIRNEEISIWMKKRERLVNGEPLDYLIGSIDFLDYKINLSFQTLIPRPETQEWIVWILNKYHQKELPRVDYLLDLGTGSGLIAIALSKISEKIILTDIEIDCLEIANKNCLHNNIKNFTTIHSNGLQNSQIEKSISDSSWGLVANLPYLPISDKLDKIKNNLIFEPDLALYSGNNGLQLFSEVIETLTKMTSQPEYIFFELDPRNIYTAKEILDWHYSNVSIWCDSLGNPRVLYSSNLTIPYKKPSNSN